MSKYAPQSRWEWGGLWQIGSKSVFDSYKLDTTESPGKRLRALTDLSVGETVLLDARVVSPDYQGIWIEVVVDEIESAAVRLVANGDEGFWRWVYRPTAIRRLT